MKTPQIGFDLGSLLMRFSSPLWEEKSPFPWSLPDVRSQESEWSGFLHHSTHSTSHRHLRRNRIFFFLLYDNTFCSQEHTRD